MRAELGSPPAPDAPASADVRTDVRAAAAHATARVPRPGGTPARARPSPVSTEARLLGIAAEHLRRLGPRRVTVVGVAAEAGMTHANVYRYFPSKHALLDAVAGRWLRAVETELAGIADAPDPPDDKLERLLTAWAAAQREAQGRDPHLFAVHHAAALALRPVARRHRTRLRALVERVIEEGVGTGAFAPCDRERTIAYVFDASYRFTHPLAIGRETDLPADLLRARSNTAIQAILCVLRAGLSPDE